MSDKDTGGQAFPNEGFNGWGEPCQGMTLRDYFAATAPMPSDDWIRMQTQHDHTKNPYNESHKPKLRSTLEIISSYKFEYADAMLAERAK